MSGSPAASMANIGGANIGEKFDVLAVGNAIVDIIAQTDEAFLTENAIIKAAMNLIDAPRAELLYSSMGAHTEASGGSAANTAAAVASFGSKAAYFGKVADDALGRVFRRDIEALGVAFPCPPLPQAEGIPTARSMIFITPDGERSMNTYLGACTRFTEADIAAAVVKAADITYFEGYLWDSAAAKQAMLKIAALSRQAGGKVAMSLSDSFCVHRFRAEFLQLIRGGVIQILFANEAELKALYETEDFSAALNALRADKIELAAITRDARGSVILAAEAAETHEIAAVKIEKIVDATGAGDLYAAGFLSGLTRGLSLPECGRLGSFAAALVIGQIGPRLPFSLSAAAQKAGLL